MNLAFVLAGMVVAFFAIDLLWLGVLARDFYRRHLGHLMADRVRWGAALLFYAVYLVAVLVFVVQPGLESGSLSSTVARGAFLGTFAYATFDLTCLALFKNFPVRVAWVDIVWGTVLTAAVSAAGYGIGAWLGMTAGAGG